MRPRVRPPNMACVTLGMSSRVTSDTIESTRLLGVIVSCPEKAQIQEALPLHRRIVCFLRDGQDALIIGSCQFKLSKRFVCLTTCPIEGGGRGIRKMGYRLNRSSQMFESSAWCIESECLFSGALSVLDCL